MKASAFANEDPVPFNPSLIDGKYLVCQPNQQFIHINSERNLMSKIYVLAFVFRLGFVEFNLLFSLYHLVKLLQLKMFYYHIRCGQNCKSCKNPYFS